MPEPKITISGITDKGITLLHYVEMGKTFAEAEALVNDEQKRGVLSKDGMLTGA